MNVLILRPDHIGDMLLTTPLLSALRNGFPEWHITVLCGSWSLPILENNPDYDETVVCNYPWLARGAKAPWKTFLSTVRNLRSKKFDILINLRKAAKSAAVARIINGKQVWGYDVGKSAWAHTDTITYRADHHIADLYLEFASAMGVSIEKNTGLLLYLTEEEINNFTRRFPLPERFAVVAPCTGDSERMWKEERWAQVADWILNELHLSTVFIGSASERLLVSRITGRMHKEPLDMTGQLTIRQVGMLIKRAQFLVSVNSAPVHLASAVKTPVVALYGPNNPVHWGPYPNGRANQSVSKVKEFKLGRGASNRSGGMDLLKFEDVRSSIKILCEAENIGKGKA